MNENNDLSQKIKQITREEEKTPAPEPLKPLKIPDFNKKPEPKKEEVVEAPKVTNKPLITTDYALRGIIFFILSVLLLIAVYLTYRYSQTFMMTGEKTKEQNLVFENQLVRADRSRVISLEAGVSKEGVRSIIVQALKNERVNNGEVSLVMPAYLRETIIDNKKELISEPQRGDDFFFTFAVRSPINLRTIASEKYAVGTLGIGSGEDQSRKNFFVFSVSSPADATREMLNWENQMYYDMKEVLELREIKGELSFRDLSSNNHLFRVASDDDGVMLVYGFGGPKTIIIAPNAETFEAVYQRLK